MVFQLTPGLLNFELLKGKICVISFCVLGYGWQAGTTPCVHVEEERWGGRRERGEEGEGGGGRPPAGPTVGTSREQAAQSNSANAK